MKNSFTLLETLASIVLLGIVISGFLNLSSENVSYKKYIDIQILKNKIASNNLSNFSTTKIDINTDEETISYISGNTFNSYTYNGEFKLIYNSIPPKEQTLKSKTFE